MTEVVLHDVDEQRLRAIGAGPRTSTVAASPTPPPCATTTDVDDALRGADFVFSAIRVGGLVGRTLDERVALDLGVLGQETTGPGGLAYALRTVPVALDLARRTRELAPDAWFINFTNPAGIVTEAMQSVLGDRVIGICDSPIALARRAIGALRLDPAAPRSTTSASTTSAGCAALHVDGVDHLPGLLADPAALATLEEGRLFGPEWLAALGAIPNEYLYYYYFAREARAAILAAPQTRGEFLRDQQDAFYAAVASDPRRTPRPSGAACARSATRPTCARPAQRTRSATRPTSPAAATRGSPWRSWPRSAVASSSSMILNIRGGGAVPGMPADAVVEIPCVVDRDGRHAPRRWHLSRGTCSASCSRSRPSSGSSSRRPRRGRSRRRSRRSPCTRWWTR